MATKKKISSELARTPDVRMSFIKTVKFGGLGLDNAEVYIDRLGLAKVRKKQGTVHTQIDITQSVLTHEDDLFVVAADFVLKQTSNDIEGDLLSIKSRFSGLFKLTKPASRQAVDEFASLEARVVFFPYLRHFVSDVTYRMAIDPIVLPMTSEL